MNTRTGDRIQESGVRSQQAGVAAVATKTASWRLANSALRSAVGRLQSPYPALHRSAATTILALTLYALTCPAATLVTSSLDSGGGRSSAGSYVNDGSLGAIGGISSAGSQITRHGYPGQLTEVTGLSVTGVPAQVNEGATSQLSGSATMDDATVTLLSGSDLTWGAYAWPIHDISASGVATTTWVYANTPTTVNCTYLGAAGSGSLLVLDSLPDNYGSYAGDNLADSWQIRYFGLPPNSNAAPTIDPDGDGQNNQFEYLAGIDPTNSASAFRVISLLREGSDVRVIWTTVTNRAYNVWIALPTVAGSYTNAWNPVPLTPFPVAGTATNVYWLDIGGATNGPSRYYQVSVLPPE